MNEKGLLLIISGPSGVGKGTVIEALRSQLRAELGRELYLSVSMTTRAPRPGEIDGVHYSFVTREDFAKLVELNGFAEFAEFAGNFYGTPLAPIHDHIAAGDIVVFDIEVVGAANMRTIFPDAESVFITPPSFEELRRRLSGRGTESAESLEKRLRIAESECLRSGEFNHIICNDSVENASRKILDIIKNQLSK